MNIALSVSSRRVVLGALVSVGLLAAGTDLAWSAGAAPAAASSTTIGLRHSSRGKVLDGTARRFAYVHVNAAGKDARCNPLCQGIWPFVTSAGKPHAGRGVAAAKLRRTAAHQVTYRGHRLYYYGVSPQSTAGDGARSFGGTWKLINAKGTLK